MYDRSRMMSTNDSITGRDDYIIAQALYVAATALRSQKQPEYSNADDMEAISEAWFPGNFESRRVLERMQEGVRMGLKLPSGGLTMEAESVETWIAAGIANERVDDPAELFISAHAMAFTMQGHLRGTSRISGLSDDDARKQLEQSQATMDRLTPSPEELMSSALPKAAA